MNIPCDEIISIIHSSSMPIPTPLVSRHVAVVGAGAGGLVAARELRNEGHSVVVYENQSRLGGTWVYDPDVESDPICQDPSRTMIHSSLYDSLRTNLPREAMGFRDFPFVAKDGIGRDARRFPGHKEVLMYLEDFADEFRIGEMIRFDSEVRYVGLVDGGKWRLRSWEKRDGEFEDVYDAVVVCNGHYAEPKIADIPGIGCWPGKQMHSHNYRVPEPFRDQVVVLIGSAASAVDISIDIAAVAKEVHIASRSAKEVALGKQPGYKNMWLHSMITSAHEDGTVVFQDGSKILANVILHCTGYKYHFPFLDTSGMVTVDDSRVGPLYKHVFPPALAPGLSFVGLPWKVVPFPLCELQSKWIAGVLSGRISLPSQEEMMEDIEAFYTKLEAAGIPKRYTHNCADCQFEYGDWLATKCGCHGSEEWRKEMYSQSSKTRHEKPGSYRDEWSNNQLFLQALEDFRKFLPPALIDILCNSL
uniref:Flavin-containing monooxygenase n=1 Tax=Kalanchoe fedtschenkoi TaxID=63787 RepID=A0A7N0TKY3_KALFE